MIAHLKRFLVVAALVLSSIRAFAGAPGGTLYYGFNIETVPVWDFTGSYQITQQIVGPDDQLVDVTFGVTIAQDDRGNIAGHEVTVVSVGSLGIVGGEYFVSGKVTSVSDGFARLRMKIKISAEGVVAGVFTRATFTIRYDAEVNSVGELNGIAKGTASFSKLGSGRINSEFFHPVPTGADGSWILTMNILPISKLAGSATATFPSGKIVLFDLDGHYSASRDDSRITLRGVGPSRGAKLKVVLGGDSSLFSIRGKLLGQKVSF